MQEKLNIAVFVDYDNIEIGVKSTLRREFDVSLALDALKERGDIVAKFAYANWGRQEGATRQMAENAVQMVQRIPSPRGDKNGADINLALDALEMAFTHSHVNAFAIISGDSDFIPLVNKLKEYGKTVFVVGGRAFTSTILQQNCHEFVSYESLLMIDSPPAEKASAAPSSSGPSITLPGEQRAIDHARPASGGGGGGGGDRPRKEFRERDRDRDRDRGERRGRPAPLELEQAMPLVERALQVLERRGVQPQLGLLKSTMLQLDSTFSERAYGASSFSEFVERLKKGEFVNVTGQGGRLLIERKASSQTERPVLKPEDALPSLRDVLETHRLDLENGATADELSGWVAEEQPSLDWKAYGYQEFTEFLNYAQDKLLVRLEPEEERGIIVHLGAEFYPPAPPPKVEPEPAEVEEEDDGPQPIVEGQPTIFEPNPPPPPPKPVKATRKRASKKAASGEGTTVRRPRKKKTE
ncbi:MAG: NYN domain-containing protein [Acidobacteria bacterium]|nr:NYN domain-containing protein [Acidobacteriota bacterium]